MHQGICCTCRLPPRMFLSAYCQIICGEFLELEYTPTVIVDALVTGYSRRVEAQDNGTSYSHIL